MLGEPNIINNRILRPKELQLTQKISDTAAQLLKRLSEKDFSALREVYMQYFRQLTYYGHKLVSDQLVAEDVVADSFLKIYERPVLFTTEEQLRGYLFTLVKNGCLDYLRSSARHAQIHQKLVLNSDQFEKAADSAIIRSEAVQIIHAEIQKLPVQCREVIKLSYVEGKTIPEIVSQLGIAYKTVQNHKARGLQMLRASMLERGMDRVFAQFLVAFLIES